MGIASSTPSDGRVVKLLPVPMSFFLLALGSSSLVLWSDWTNPGSEQLVWDINLKDILTHDMSSLDLFGDTGAFSMVDACLMPAEPGAENGTLLVLSTFENRAGSLNGSLWIHTLSVQFSSEAIGATVTILHRLVLSEHACWVQQGSIAPATVGPRIHHLSPSWKVFVSWSAESQAQPQPQSQQRCDREEAGGARTVHGAQIDVLNQALLNASVSREGDQRSRKQALLDAVRCSSGVNSLIDAKTVLDAAAVKGQDGIVIVTNGTRISLWIVYIIFIIELIFLFYISDGTISLFTPPLPKRALADFPLTTTTLRDRLSATSSSSAVTVATPAVAQTTITDAASLLHSAALGEVASEDVGKTVRDVFDALAVSADIAAAVQAASTKLMNRSPTGEYWGLGSGSAERSSFATVAGARALTQYQMVHRLVETKLNAHKKLIEIVNSSVSSSQ